MNPTTEARANCEGIVYIATRMDWYWNLSRVLVTEIDGGSSAGLRNELENRIIHLYKALLLYQIYSVCSYYRNRGLVFLRRVVSLDDWDGSLNMVQDAENALRMDLNMYNEQQTRSNLLQDIRRGLQEQLLAQMIETDQQCLQDLRLTDPRNDMARIEQNNGGLLEDSCKWILDHPDFRKWRDEDRRVLWIEGGPGTGKTMLVISIINHLEKLIETSDAGILSFFFCQYTDAQLNNATAVLRGLIFLLIMQQSDLISHLLMEYRHAGPQLFNDRNSFYALRAIFQNMLRDPRLTAAYLIVDGLDECETGLSELLSLIAQTVSTPATRVKWLVSSRSRRDVGQILVLDNSGIRLNLETVKKSVSNAIDVYIDRKVSQLSQIRDNKAIQDRVRTFVRQGADGTFLWVALVFKELQSVPRYSVLDVLESLVNMPTGLTSLYDRMMNQIERLRARDPEICRSVLRTVTVAYRPLHLLELPILAGFEGHLAQKVSLEGILMACGSFLTIREDYIYLIHQSAKDYLVTRIFPQGPEAIHFDMFSRSLRALSQFLVKDIYNIKHDGVLSDKAKPRDGDPLASFRYSCLFWVEHLCHASSQASRQAYGYRDVLSEYGGVSSFLRDHFLHWLESLSYLQKLSEGVLSIRMLLNTVQVCQLCLCLHGQH
jgi:hypothetical protein